MRRSSLWYCIVPVFAIVLILGPFSGRAPARDLAAYLDEAKRLADKNQLPEAMDVLRLSVEKIWQRMPLTVVRSVLVTEKPQGYSMYEPRPDNVYNSGDPILLYLEPVGFEVKRQEDKYLYGLVADFQVTSEEGRVLDEKKNFGRWVLKSWRFNPQFYLGLRYSISGLEPGEYVIETILRDLNGPETTTVKTPIVIK